jgi:hypothetical protein
LLRALRCESIARPEERVADSATDTSVVPLGGGRLRAELSPAWEVWGPVGGYVAAIALRALAAETELPRPASFHCDFLSVAKFGAVDLEVATLRRGKRSHALRVAMTQQQAPILVATAWFVADGMTGLQHESGVAPDLAPPDARSGRGRDTGVRSRAAAARARPHGRARFDRRALPRDRSRDVGERRLARAAPRGRAASRQAAAHVLGRYAIIRSHERMIERISTAVL